MRKLLLLGAVLVGSHAVADAKHPNPFLNQAKVFFTQNEGEKCLKRLIQAEQKWKFNDKKDKAEIELYGGMCGYLIGETKAAEVSFTRALGINPKVTLPPGSGAGIEGLWAKVTGKPVPAGTATASAPPATAKPAAARPAEPVKPEPIAARSDTPKETKLTPDQKLEQDLMASAPAPSKGRSYVLPAVLGGGAVVAGGVGAYLGVTAKGLEAKYNDPQTFQSDADHLGPQAKGMALGANIAFGVAGALAVGALATLIFGG